MKISLIDSRKTKRNTDALYLTEKDLVPWEPLFYKHQHLKPESFDEVVISGLLEHSVYIRYILKVADYLLVEKGKLVIEFFCTSFDAPSSPYRNRAALMHEVSVVFKERLRVVDRQLDSNLLTVSLEKIAATLPKNDSIECWTFGLVSDGRKNDRILQTIEDIAALNIPFYEVVICGPAPSDPLPEHVKVLPDKDLFFDVRVPISKKKNRIVQHAKYNNLVLFHDRIGFSKDWYKKMVEYGNYFDGLCIRIVDEQTKTSRIQDWISTSLDKMSFRNFRRPPVELAYNEWVPNWNINGGFMIVKKHLFDRVKLNPFLHWGEAEDGDLCRGLDRDGFAPTFDSRNFVTSTTLRLSVVQKKSGILGFLQRVKKTFYEYRRFRNNQRLFYKYLKDS